MSVQDHHLVPGQLWSRAQRARLLRLCTALVGDYAVAEDLAQESLLEAWRLQGRLTDPAGVEPWLNAIARNVCRRWLRARGAAAVPTCDESLLEGGNTAGDLDAVLEREETVALLDRALALLPGMTREALVAHYVEGLSHAEIALRLGCSVDAVSMRLSRGRSRLRYLLETRFVDEAVAETWGSRHDMGWRSTRVWCPQCGRCRIAMRHDRTEVAFRCLVCDPGELSVRLPLDTPVFQRLVSDVRRPSAIQARIAQWSMTYWQPTGDPPTPRCVRCDRLVTPLPYTREGPTWPSSRGWYIHCAGCGEEVSGSIAGLALSLPHVRATRKREPRLRALPVRDVIRDGYAAKVVGYGGPDGRSLVNAVFLRDSLRLVHVDG